MILEVMSVQVHHEEFFQELSCFYVFFNFNIFEEIIIVSISIYYFLKQIDSDVRENLKNI